MKLLWKIYFWIFIFILILTLFPIGSWTFVDFGWLLSILIMLVLLYSYIYGKPVQYGKLWKILLLLSIGYYVLYTLYLDPNYGFYPPTSIFDYLVTLLIPLPGFIGAVLYIKGRK